MFLRSLMPCWLSCFCKWPVSPLRGRLLLFGCCRVGLFATPWPAARQASLSFTLSQSWLRLMSIELVMLSNRLILCHPLLLLPSIIPSIRVFSSESALHIKWPRYWSFSFRGHLEPSLCHCAVKFQNNVWFELGRTGVQVCWKVLKSSAWHRDTEVGSTRSAWKIRESTFKPSPCIGWLSGAFQVTEPKLLSCNIK